MENFKQTFSEYLNDNEFKRMSLDEQVEELYNVDLNFKHCDKTTGQRVYNEAQIRTLLMELGLTDFFSLMSNGYDKLKQLQGKSIFLTDDEQGSLQGILRDGFDSLYTSNAINNLINKSEFQNIISISKKLELDNDFIKELENDLEV